MRSFVADPKAVQFDSLPPGLMSLSGLTALRLNNCFAEPDGFGEMSQLQCLALEVCACLKRCIRGVRSGGTAECMRFLNSGHMPPNKP